MIDLPFFLAELSQPRGPGGQTSFCTFFFCSYRVGKTHSVKFDPELRVYRLEWSIFVQNIHLLGVTQGVHAQGS